MADITNNNPPAVEENSEKTIERLEKIKGRIETSSTIVKSLGVAFPFIAGFAWNSIAGSSGMTELTALAAFPIITTVVAAHAYVRDMFERKIDSLKDKLKGSALMASMLIKQKMRLKDNKEDYNLELERKKGGASNDESFDLVKQSLKKEKEREAVFSKSAELAKQEGKEKTIGRLMSIVDKHNNKASTYLLGAGMQAAYALFVTPSAIDMVINKNPDPLSMACGAAATVTFSAMAYCAAKAVQANKRNKNSDRAYNILQKYTSERT